MKKNLFYYYNLENIRKAIFFLALPAIFSLFLLMSYNFFNSYFIVHNVSKKKAVFVESGLNFSNLVYVIMLGFSMLIGVGVTTTLSRYFAKSDKNLPSNYISSIVYFIFFYTIIITLILYFLVPQLAKIQNINAISGRENVTENVSTYFSRTQIFGLFFFNFSIILNFVIRSENKILQPIALSIIICAINVFLLWVFLPLVKDKNFFNIYSPDPENQKIYLCVIWAAICNIISWICGVLLYVTTIYYNRIKKFSYLNFFNKVPLKDFFYFQKITMQYGLTSFGRNMGNAAIIFLTNFCLRKWGTVPYGSIVDLQGHKSDLILPSTYWQSVYAVISVLIVVTSTPIFGTMQATRNYILYNWTKKKHQVCKSAINKATIFIFSYYLLIFLFFAAFGFKIGLLWHLQNGNIQTTQGHQVKFPFIQTHFYHALLITFSCTFLYTFTLISMPFYLTIKKIYLSIFVGWFRSVLLELPLIILISLISWHYQNIWIIWSSYPLMDIIAALLIIPLYIYNYRKYLLKV
ncbi:MATE family efflux transporter [symbiont of Argiope bruennichi]|uniref:MATE family efflux transporter n=1 Tax=symbiont of Argiope bruennichi TaxID=2810479 RepID=UPI003DA2E828